MNGRLATLAEQAGYFTKFERTGNDVTVVYTKEPGTDGDLALFGELIVEDIMELLNHDSGDLDYIKYLIKRDFGIKDD
jgi:hypothetical protein